MLWRLKTEVQTNKNTGRTRTVSVLKYLEFIIVKDFELEKEIRIIRLKERIKQTQLNFDLLG